MQLLRDKLAVAERTAKAEAQLKVRELTYFWYYLLFSYFINFMVMVHPLTCLGEISTTVQSARRKT